jgi:hypothetical protein
MQWPFIDPNSFLTNKCKSTLIKKDSSVMNMKRFTNYIEQVHYQNKRTKTQFYLAIFSIALFPAIAITLPNYVIKKQQTYKSQAQQAGPIRLGLLYTQEELNIWRQRAQSGPYKSQGDVSTNSPGDWDRIVSKKNTFMSDPSADHWTGWTENRCLTRDDVLPGTVGRGAVGAFTHDAMMNAAFYALMMNDATVRNAVRDALLAQARDPGVDFTNTTRWCSDYMGVDQNNFWGTAIWLGRLAVTYDFIRNDLSSADRTVLDTWFYQAADLYRQQLNRQLGSEERFPRREQG